ncbi:MAG: hypothetical protein P8L18_03480 [Verrucomicrobiota bacterium]|nr:hypothetical protein [Verrucomicrobiota bacterium]
MNDWNIQSRSRACHGCERGFEDQQVYHSLLFSRLDAYLREDVCDACWQSQFADTTGATKGFISHWRSHYKLPPPPSPEAIRKDTAESLLGQLTSRNAPEYAGALYILAVMLERKRVLKVRDQLKEGKRRIFVYEHSKSGDVYTIAEPDLRLEQLEKIQNDVAHLMENGLPQQETAQNKENQASHAEAATVNPPRETPSHGEL